MAALRELRIPATIVVPIVVEADPEPGDKPAGVLRALISADWANARVELENGAAGVTRDAGPHDAPGASFPITPTYGDGNPATAGDIVRITGRAGAHTVMAFGADAAWVRAGTHRKLEAFNVADTDELVMLPLVRLSGDAS